MNLMVVKLANVKSCRLERCDEKKTFLQLDRLISCKNSNDLTRLSTSITSAQEGDRSGFKNDRLIQLA